MASRLRQSVERLGRRLLIFFVSLLFLAGVAGFAIIFAMSLHKDLAVGVPAGNLAARIVSNPWTLSAMTVGFLSVPDADRVADRIREAIEQIPPKRR